MAVFRFRFAQAGGHTHTRVFAGIDMQHLGKCGDLVMTNDEWQAFRNRLPQSASVSYVEEEAGEHHES